jgi:hypothetical protein
MALVEARALDRVAADTDSRLTAVSLRARIAIVARGAIWQATACVRQQIRIVEQMALMGWRKVPMEALAIIADAVLIVRGVGNTIPIHVRVLDDDGGIPLARHVRLGDIVIVIVIAQASGQLGR